MIATTNNIAGLKAESPSLSLLAAPPVSQLIRVWLTDDNAGFRDLLEELLVRSGNFNCEFQFHSAEALLEGLATEPAPDVILLDVEMGGMTGVEALQPIRALAPEVRVLMVTSFWDPLYETKALRDGASAYLIKAHAPMNLVSEIHRALSSPVKLTSLVPVITVEPNSPTSQPVGTASRSFAARLRFWAAQWSATLLRTAPVSTAESHP